MPLLTILNYRDGNGQRLVNHSQFVGQEMLWIYEEASFQQITFDGDALYQTRYRLEALQDEDYLSSQDF